MRHHPEAPGRAARALGIVITLALLATAARAQDPAVNPDGSEVFCHILKYCKLEPIASIAELSNHGADETLIVIFGDLTALNEIRKHQPNLDRHAILLASDRDSGKAVPNPGDPNRFFAINLLEPWQLQILGMEVHQPRDTAYQARPRCPWIEFTPRHPIFRNVTQGIATNRPSLLLHFGRDLEILGAFPTDCLIADVDNWAIMSVLKKVRGRMNYLAGTPGSSPQRTLILGGHGVFMNGMLVQKDNDNFLFAYNTIKWLQDGKRKYALMIHDGKVIDKFGLPLTGPSKVPVPPVQVVNDLLRKLENEGIFTRMLQAIGWNRVLQFALLLGTFGLVVYGFYRLFLARHTLESAPLLVGILPPPAPGRPLLAQRTMELLAQNNLWEPAQALARQWFADHAHVDAPLWDEASSSAGLAAAYDAGWWSRLRLGRQVRELWQFATRDPARRVSLSEFRRLTYLVQSLTAAVGARRLAFPRVRPKPA